MKMKHNKKRNTAFIFEVLIRELTKAIIEQDDSRKKYIIKLVKENFKGNSLLARDLEIYKMVLDTTNVDRTTAEKLIYEARLLKSSIDHRKLFVEQGTIIETINKTLPSDVFNNFVPNYKDLATVFQIFHPKTRTKDRVLLEVQVVERMLSEKASTKKLVKPIDNLTYRSFVKAFNKKYKDSLLSEQKDLLKAYINSFADNSIDLKIFLNEEIPRLQEAIERSKTLPALQHDAQMFASTEHVLQLIDSLKKREINQEYVHEVLKLQTLVKEIES